MTEKKLWQELANLRNKGWKVCFGAFDQISLTHDGVSGVIDPVMALACDKNNYRTPECGNEVIRILDLSDKLYRQVINAAIEFPARSRARQKLIRVLGIKH